MTEEEIQSLFDCISSCFDNDREYEIGRKLQLHYWFIDKSERECEVVKHAHGIVTGHERLSDSVMAHTTRIKEMHVDELEEELVITTRNSVYYLPLAYCDFNRQDEYPDVIPDYIRIKEKYKDRIDYPSIESGKVLLVLSNFCEYYFHSLYYVPQNSEDDKSVEYQSAPHIGSFQDSYLIRGGENTIDLRYFPHYRNIEFYVAKTDDCPLYIENIGDVVLYARTSAGTIKYAPGERKEVAKENAEKEPPILSGGDLYPAGFIDASEEE